MEYLLALIVVALAWIGIEIHRFVRFIQREYYYAECSPDADFPAFARAQIRAQMKQLDESRLKFHHLDERWNSLDENVRTEILDQQVYTQHHLKCAQFMIEANLMVRRGELTIGEAQEIFHREIDHVGPAHLGKFEGGRFLSTQERIAQTVRATEEKSKQLSPRQAELMRLAEQWQSKFVAFNGGPPPAVLASRRLRKEAL